jgi:hypothetical protein
VVALAEPLLVILVTRPCAANSAARPVDDRLLLIE